MGLKERYTTEVIPALTKEFGFKNPNAVPRILSVTLNVGLGRGLKDAKFQDTAESTLTRITGSKPVKTLARKSIAAFKIRQNMVIGLKVTLRNKRMWDFLEKLVKVSLPRVRDFRGISGKSFDGRGNYSLGFTEHMAFPEIRPDEIEMVHGLQLTVHTNAGADAPARALLAALGFPFKEEEKKR